MRKKLRTVFIPIETTSREFHYKLVLAHKLARAGCRVVVGQAGYLDKISKCFPSGVYLGKNIFKTLFPTSQVCYIRYKTMGWDVLHLDEEGGVFAGREKEWIQQLDRRLDPSVLNEHDKILCWGEFQARHYRGKSHNSKVIATGQPKFYYKDVEYRAIFDQFSVGSDYILFNMNFAAFNSLISLTDFLTSSDSHRHSKDDDYSYKRDVWLDNGANLIAILNVIKKLLEDDRFNHLHFIVRPHPAENQAIYENMFLGKKRVLVTKEGTAIEWALNSKAVVHHGCTTGVESFLAGVKVINFRESVVHSSVENLIANSVGLRINNYDELCDYLLDPKCNNGIENIDLCHSMISNFDKDLNSFEKVVDETNDSLKRHQPGYMSLFLDLVVIMQAILLLIKYVPRLLMKNKLLFYKREREKFKIFKPYIVKNKVSVVNEISKSNIQVKKIRSRYFVLEKSN